MVRGHQEEKNEGGLCSRANKEYSYEYKCLMIELDLLSELSVQEKNIILE